MQYIRSLLAGTALAAVALAAAPSPAYACHEPTGFCCIEKSDNSGDLFCCAWSDDKLVGCGTVK